VKGVSSDRSWVVAEDEKKRENSEKTCVISIYRLYYFFNFFLLAC
jgi:hypothetical protein